MITVSFKVDNEAFTFRIDSIFVGCNNKCVLHFPIDYNKSELYKFSLGYCLELYKYEDGHIGLTIQLDSIYSLKYDKED